MSRGFLNTKPWLRSSQMLSACFRWGDVNSPSVRSCLIKARLPFLCVKDALALHLSEQEHVPVLLYHLACPAARSCPSRAALLFIICSTCCCERSCQSLLFRATAVDGKALAEAAPGYVALL